MLDRMRSTLEGIIFPEPPRCRLQSWQWCGAQDEFRTAVIAGGPDDPAARQPAHELSPLARMLSKRRRQPSGSLSVSFELDVFTVSPSASGLNQSMRAN